MTCEVIALRSGTNQDAVIASPNHPSKEFDMNDLNAQVRRYVDIWNQPDGAQRAALIDAAFIATASYVDPLVRADGAEALNATIGVVQQQFPGHRFEPYGTPDAHGRHLRFSWALKDAGGTVAARGTDIAVLADDGRFSSVTGFLDYVASAAR
jgi:hypothetical protein